MSLRISSIILMCCCFWGIGAAQERLAVGPILKEGDAAYRKGDYEAARRSFEKAREAAEETAANDPVRYDVLKRLASVHTSAGEFNEAERYLQQALHWRETVLGANDVRVADDLLVAMNLYMGMKDFDRALAAIERARTIHTAAFSPDSIPVADDFRRIAQIYLARHMPADAVQPLVTARDIRIKLTSPLDPGLLPILDALCDAYNAMKRSGATAGFYRQALLIREAMYGKDSSELISTIDGLAQACFERREYEEAEPLYKRLLSLWETQIGKDHPMVAVVLDKLVVFYAEQKKLAQAKEALARSVAVRERFLAVGLSHQGGEARAENDLAQARFFYQRALGVLEPGADNQEIVRQISRLIKELDAAERSEEDRKVGGKPR